MRRLRGRHRVPARRRSADRNGRWRRWIRRTGKAGDIHRRLRRGPWPGEDRSSMRGRGSPRNNGAGRRIFARWREGAGWRGRPGPSSSRRQSACAACCAAARRRAGHGRGRHGEEPLHPEGRTESDPAPAAGCRSGARLSWTCARWPACRRSGHGVPRRNSPTTMSDRRASADRRRRPLRAGRIAMAG